MFSTLSVCGIEFDIERMHSFCKLTDCVLVVRLEWRRLMYVRRPFVAYRGEKSLCGCGLRKWEREAMQIFRWRISHGCFFSLFFVCVCVLLVLAALIKYSILGWDFFARLHVFFSCGFVFVRSALCRRWLVTPFIINSCTVDVMWKVQPPMRKSKFWHIHLHVASPWTQEIDNN